MNTKATTPMGVAAQDIEAAPQLDTNEDAAAAFLSKWSEEDPETQASEAPEEDDKSEETPDEEVPEDEANADAEDDDGTETDPQDDSEDGDDDGDEEEPKEEPKKVLEDEALVKIKVDGEELEVSVKDLKRLYGQEAALTRKSQEAAAKRKEAEAAAMKASATLQKMYEKAAAKWEPYSKIDYLVAQKQLDTDAFAALRAEAQAAYEDFRFISEEADTFVKQTQAQQQQQLQEAAKEAVKVLREAIPNWSPTLYDQIREYAIGTGMDAEVVNNLVDPVAIQLLHKARLYDESKKIATKKKVVAPKKVVKSTVTSNPQSMKADATVKAKKTLQTSGSVDDAANLFLSRWANED
jgi:hypothetical protein